MIIGEAMRAGWVDILDTMRMEGCFVDVGILKHC